MSSFMDFVINKSKREYKVIVDLIKRREYAVVFYKDEDHRFGISNEKYTDRVLALLQQEINKNPQLLSQMYNQNYHRADFFIDQTLTNNPSIIETLINSNDDKMTYLISKAIDYGYNPEFNYVDAHIKVFSDGEIMRKLMDKGYKPSDEIVERAYSYNGDNIFLLKAISWGFVPSLNFIKKYNLLANPNLVDIIIDTIELTPGVINSEIFYGRSLAQQRIVNTHPELLSSLSMHSASYEQFMIEAFKVGYMPEKLDISITSNFLLLSKLVKKHPEAVKYSRLTEDEQRKQIDELALCMGYVPTINDVRNTEYVKKSMKLMSALISSRPEAIKYIETRPLKGGYSLDISQDEFFILARQALDNGYIPTVKDLELNPRLRDSFDIMKYLIQDDPDLINMIRNETPNKEELLDIAIQSGFNGRISEGYAGEEFSSYMTIFNQLLITEKGIMYQLDHGQELNPRLPYLSYYGMDLYNYLVGKGYEIEKIVHLFTRSFDVMKDIISNHPEMITIASKDFSRSEIDELSFLAIEKGYEPKFEDDIFGHGAEIAKLMVTKYPAYLEKVELLDRAIFGFSGTLCSVYHDVCKIAVEAGFIPDINSMGNGYGGVTTTSYNYSYDIMKKAIPLRPELIESCAVEEKEKYDELCRLAIASGYKVDDEYALTHWGTKMCSSYDLMAIYIKNHPDFILKVNMDDSDELLKLIDIAISSGLKLESLKEKELLKLFLSIDEEKWNIYLDESKIETLKRARKLRVHNDEISKTVDPKFLKSHIVSKFSEEQIEILSCYPKLQDKLLRLPENDIRTEIVQEIMDKYKEHLEWTNVLEKFLNNAFSSEYSNLICDVSQRELSREEKRNLMYLLITDNHLDISSYRDLENIDAIRKEYIDVLMKRGTVESLKTAYLEKIYSIDLATAINLVNLYGRSLDNKSIEKLDENSKRIFVILRNMKKIINLNSKELLQFYIDNVNPDFIIDPDLMIMYESKLKYLFTQEFNKSFTKPLLEDRIESRRAGEEDLDIYLAAGRKGNKQCRMIITSIGAYTNMKEPDDYYASWNVEKISSHGCCCSYVGEKNLGTAEVKYCCLGFTDYELGSLQLSGPYDLCSASTEESYQIASTYSSMYLLPDDVLAYTRHTHNETVWERRNIGKNSKFKKQPSYIVYFVDNFEDRLTDDEAKRQWESVKKAAANFAHEVDGRIEKLPIMVVEREKIARAQLENIEANLEKFQTTLDSDLIAEIISDYESNYAGNRNYHTNITEKYFPQHTSLDKSVVGKIIETIRNMDDSKKALECILALEIVVKNEQEKYNNTQHGVGQSIPSFNIEVALIEINNMKSKYKKDKLSVLDMISKVSENNRQFTKSDLGVLDKSIIESQFSSDDVLDMLEDSDLSDSIAKYDQEIVAENINAKLKVHGQRHVKNVLLYSSLVGKQVIRDKHDLELLQIAAKYHDSGRKTEGHEEHAKSSAEFATNRLKNLYSKEDLSIIATIIEFHEIPRDLANVDEIFYDIAKKNGVAESILPRVRNMAEVLKDADALDRTRFINQARLNPSYLKFDISKRLVRFAASLQEAYALEDLQGFHAEEDINRILEVYTPQEVLRTIRHSTRGGVREEEIRTFIKTWAETIEMNDNTYAEEGSVKHGK